MRKLFFFVIFLGSLTLRAQQPAEKSSGRYQIITATVGNGDLINEKTIHIVFLLDTQTGQIWRYFAAAGGVRDLKPEEQYTLDGGTSIITAVSPGSFVPVKRLDTTEKSNLQRR